MKTNLTFILIIGMLYSYAATYTTTATPGTWDIGGSPGASDDIIVNHDWSSYDAAAIANYAGTMTVNSGGYYKINGSFTNFTGVMDIKSGGVFLVTGSVSTFAGGSVNVDGYMRVDATWQNYDDITGSGEISAGTWSNFGTVAGTVTLPVELIKFSVKSNDYGVLLEWATASEVNNDYFEIQRSFDGINFEVIDIINGNGNSFERIDYNYLDDYSGEAYYRLKQVDFDGSYAFSHIIYVGSGDWNVIDVLPSANQNEFSVINLPYGEVQISVYDLNGKLCYINEFFSEEGGVSNVKININGMGLFSIITRYGLTSKKVIVK